jgi:hypothetical protein
MSSFLFRTKLLLWDQSPGDKEVVVAYDGDSLHTFLLDLDNVAGASVPALGKYRQRSFQCYRTGSGTGAFLTPGSGMNIPGYISDSLETHFWVKILKFFDPEPDPALGKCGQRSFLQNSAGDPDPQDPHVFGPPGSGSISQRYGSGSGSFPFLIAVLSRLK